MFDSERTTVPRRRSSESPLHGVDRLVQRAQQTLVDTLTDNHRIDLGVALPPDPRQLRIRIFEGSPRKNSTDCRLAFRDQSGCQPTLHANLFRPEERALGGGGHPHRLVHDPLVRCGNLAA